VPDLQDMARLIPGRKSHVEPNPYEVGDFVFKFRPKKDEAFWESEWMRRHFSVRVGLDNVYRFTDIPVYADTHLIRAAYKGIWSAEDTFTVYFRAEGDTKRGQFQFEGDDVNCQLDSIPWGSVAWKGRLEKSLN